ncbi:putative mediator of RNA polymerase II transcription subunit 26b [Canna indica]|uniref:Mediator of RNA polymerase II transcription subunit 26b n=1 Tax=Canna indica TaxID=4628 RepID=A0AAQ3QGV4_9LILI|nr:putative mediator of RNA polymerase II transcription subunit 26b [Canna indica]
MWVHLCLFAMKIFDGMDDGGNLTNNEESGKRQRDGNRPSKNVETVKKSESGPAKLASEGKVSTCENDKQKQIVVTPQSKPAVIQREIPNNAQEDAIQLQVKLERTKRKLHEGYQQAENAKKRRTIQLIDPRDVQKLTQNRRPKVKVSSRNSSGWW